MNLVQTWLQSSNQFTSLSVEAVRKQQRSVATNKSVVFSDVIIRWDKMQPFTLILTATDEPLFVYKESSDVPRALIEYFKIYRRATKQKQEITEESMFPDYTKLTHTALFIKLASLPRKYVNKSICPRCYRQFEFRDRQCQQCPTKDVLIRPESFNNLDTTTF
jgi:ribosomal protein L40E